jgi:hypothetical protein
VKKTGLMAVPLLRGDELGLAVCLDSSSIPEIQKRVSAQGWPEREGQTAFELKPLFSAATNGDAVAQY